MQAFDSCDVGISFQDYPGFFLILFPRLNYLFIQQMEGESSENMAQGSQLGKCSKNGGSNPQDFLERGWINRLTAGIAESQDLFQIIFELFSYEVSINLKCFSFFYLTITLLKKFETELETLPFMTRKIFTNTSIILKKLFTKNVFGNRNEPFWYWACCFQTNFQTSQRYFDSCDLGTAANKNNKKCKM